MDPFLDSELDAKSNLAIEQHLDQCPNCATAFQAAATEQQRLARAFHTTRRTHSLWVAIEDRVAGVAATNRRSGLRTEPQSDQGWRFWLWPDRRCYAGLVVIWVLLLVAHSTSREHDPRLAPGKSVSRSVTLRLLVWLFHPRRLRVYLFASLCLITLFGLFTLFVNWRGNRPWDQLRSNYEVAGVPLSPQDVVPPNVPDDENFAMTPFLAPLYDFEPGTQQWRDTNGFHRAFGPVRFRSSHGLSKDRANGWMHGQFTELNAWAMAIDPSATTNTIAESAHAVIEGLREFDAVLEELPLASQRPHARFNVAYDAERAGGILLPHLGVLRALIDIICLRASAQLALDETPHSCPRCSLPSNLARNTHGW